MSHTRRRKATNGFAKKSFRREDGDKAISPPSFQTVRKKRAKTWPKMEEAMCFRFAYQPLSLALSNRSKDFFFSEGAFPNIFSVFWEDKTREGESGQAASQKHLLPLPYKLEGKIKEILPVSSGGTECGKTEEEEAKEFSPLHSRRT